MCLSLSKRSGDPAFSRATAGPLFFAEVFRPDRGAPRSGVGAISRSRPLPVSYPLSSNPDYFNVALAKFVMISCRNSIRFLQNMILPLTFLYLKLCSSLSSPAKP